MPTFPEYVRLNESQRISQRMFNIERHQDPGLSSAPKPDTIIQNVNVKSLHADDVLPELEKEIAVASAISTEVIETILEWNQHHKSQFMRNPDAEGFQFEEEKFQPEEFEKIEPHGYPDFPEFEGTRL